jgi:hypothetical protein
LAGAGSVSSGTETMAESAEVVFVSAETIADVADTIFVSAEPILCSAETVFSGADTVLKAGLLRAVTAECDPLRRLNSSIR